MRQRTRRPTRKLIVGGASGATLGPALTTLAVFGLQAAGHDPPAAVQAALGIILTWLVTVGAAYLAAPAGADTPVIAPT